MKQTLAILVVLAALATALYQMVIKPVKQTIQERTQAIERALNGTNN